MSQGGGAGPTVQVLLPAALSGLTGGVRRVELPIAAPGTAADVVAALAAAYPRIALRLCDETGALRRFVNLYVDGRDVRGEAGLETAVADGSVVQVMPSVAGGSVAREALAGGSGG